MYPKFPALHSVHTTHINHTLNGILVAQESNHLSFPYVSVKP